MNKSKILVVGGAGYIGSHMVKTLDSAGYDVVTLDNLSTGYRDAVSGGEFILGDLSDTKLLDEIFSASDFKAVMHFASFIQVGESVSQPAKYYENNVSNTINLLNAMVRHGVRSFIFSSTAAIFGEPRYTPIDEMHDIAPINPYGKSKAIVEQILQDYDSAYGLRSVCLRYFNACGADPDGLLGERHEPETHLIPLVLQVAAGRKSNVTVFGKDYDTFDGTCIRDFVHVVDLCQAHLLAINHLDKLKISSAFNLGNGAGFSVAEIIKTAEQVTGFKINVVQGARRKGDPARLVADPSSAMSVLGWRPQYSSLELIIAHAWAWEVRMAKLGAIENG